MASTTFCDWCGKLMEVPAVDSPLSLVGQGNGAMGNNPRSYLALSLPFHFHATGYSGEIDPDCCLGQLETFLAERAAWAHDPDQEGQEWRLVPREGAQPILSRSGRRAAARMERSAEEIERDERWRRWERKSPAERRQLIRGLLADEPLTAREIAEALEREHPDMNVVTERVRPIVAKMAEEGELGREPERYRKGDSIRYRYSLADEAA